MKRYRALILGLVSLVIIGCSSSIKYYTPYKFNTKNTILGLAPFINQTTVPLAGQKATYITNSLIHIFGVNHLVTYQIRRKNKLPLLLDPAPSKKQILYWAHRNHVQYLITGTVNEWQYKVGFDGQPVVGITLQVIDVSSNKTIWAAVGSTSGSSDTALSEVGQRLIKQLLSKFFNHA